MMVEHLRRLARYNRWANRRLYAACAELTPADYHAERPAFFGSIHGTLSHLLVVDRIWLDRIAGRPYGGEKLDDRPHPTFAALRAAREERDAEIEAATAGLDDATVGAICRYRMVTRPDVVETPQHLCWLHLFNHHTHHRGQVHDQLSQTAVPPPSLDLIYFLREDPAG